MMQYNYVAIISRHQICIVASMRVIKGTAVAVVQTNSNINHDHISYIYIATG